MADDKAQTRQADETQQTEEPHGASSARRSVDDARRELLEAIGDLRAELARLQFDEARGRVQQWVRDNPALTAFLAVGTGIVAGRLLAVMLTPAPPPPLSERARRRAQLLASEAQRRATDVGEDVSQRAATARRQAERAGREAQQRAATAGEQVSRQAREWSTAVADQAAAVRDDTAGRARALGTTLGKRTEGMRKNVAGRTEKAAEAVKASTKSAAETADTVRIGYRAARFGVKAAKVAFAALMAKKSTDWIRKIF